MAKKQKKEKEKVIRAKVLWDFQEDTFDDMAQLDFVFMSLLGGDDENYGIGIDLLYRLYSELEKKIEGLFETTKRETIRA